MTLFQLNTIKRPCRSFNMKFLFLLLRISLLSLPLASGKFHNGIPGSLHEKHQRFAMEPQDQTAIIGSRVTLPCRVIDKTGLIQWTKDDFGLGVHRNLSGFERYSMVGSDEEGDFSLDISPIMLDDDARYQCQVSPGANGAPPIRSRSAKVTVLVPPDEPKIVNGNTSIDHMVTTEDREIELECISSGGKPAAEITWIDGAGNVLTNGVEHYKNLMADKKRYEVRSILRLVPKKEHHNTTITCQAQNTADRTEKVAKLKLEVKYPPKVQVSLISGTLANEKIPEGTEIRIACQMEANPIDDLSYRWYINGELAIGDYTTELIIHNISRKYHGALVKCEVMNSVGRGDASVRLDITYGPTFRSLPKSIDVEEGDKATLSCDVDGNPTPEVVWIFNQSGKVVGTTRNLSITASNDHVGAYTCRASAMGLLIEAEANIYLKGPPSITSTKKQFGIPGETVQIECVAFSIPRPRHIHWIHNGKIINSSSGSDYTILEEVTSFGMKSTLVIRDSDTKHFGFYNCSVTNDYGHDNVEILLSGLDDSQVAYVFIVLAIILFIVMVAMISVICIKSGKKKLPPADVIPEQHHITEKGYKESDRYSTTSELKDPDRDYSEYSGTGSTATRMALNLLGNGGMTLTANGMPNKLHNDHRFSGDYTDMHGATKISGHANNGYISSYANDFSRDYSPPNSMRSVNANLKSHLIMSSSNHNNNTMNGGLDHYMSLGRSRELRQDNGLPTIPMNTMPNGIINQTLLNSVDSNRYSANYGNPFIKSASISPLPPSTKPLTANYSVTPAPPPYNRSNNSNSSFSSTTTVSNNGSLLGASGVSNGVGLTSYPTSSATVSSHTNLPSSGVTSTPSSTQITSPSRQFILPANGDLKKGSLATHV